MGGTSFDAALVQARHDALDTFSGELLGPVGVEDHLVYALPIVLDSPIPVGAVLLAAREALGDFDGDGHKDMAVGALLLFGAVQATMIGWGIARGERPHGEDRFREFERRLRESANE